jgi:hypothetical protein
MGKVKLRLRSQLIRLVVAAMLPVLIFAGTLVAMLAQRQRQAVIVGLRGTTRALSAAIDEKIASSIGSLEVLAFEHPKEA